MRCACKPETQPARTVRRLSNAERFDAGPSDEDGDVYEAFYGDAEGRYVDELQPDSPEGGYGHENGHAFFSAARGHYVVLHRHVCNVLSEQIIIAPL